MAEVMGSNPVEAWHFVPVKITGKCLSCNITAKIISHIPSSIALVFIVVAHKRYFSYILNNNFMI